uniref:Uncharacterized protein LOC114332258 n=1 Tax=Diabrotica virgifera virgifera TaxID=50390 RepID=A0A6P7FNU4_DIAVI
MYTWNETTAARGSQEVGSCLYIKQLPPEVKHLVAYSDSCGGQNKNKNIAKLFMYPVQCTSLERIDHQFYESGHSYMECDRSFGQIEKRKKKYPQVFIPDDWVDIIKKTSKNFIVTCMSDTDFLSFQYLHDNIKDPKKDEKNRIFRWRENVWFIYTNNDFLKFSFRMSRNECWTPIYTESCSKLSRGRATSHWKISIKNSTTEH